MDLVTAKKEAATRSQATKKDQYVNLKEDGEHEVSGKPGATPMLKFSNGAEVKMEVPAPKKKEVKAAAPKKKSAPKKKEVKSKTNKAMKKAAKKSASKVKVSGKHKTMSIKEILAGLKKGQRLLKPNGKKYNATKLASRADHTLKKEVIIAD